MLHNLARHYINDRLLVRRHSIGSNSIVLTQSQSRRTRCCRAQTAIMLQRKKFQQLMFWRLLEKDLAKVHDCVWVLGENNVASTVNLLLGEDGKGMSHIVPE